MMKAAMKKPAWQSKAAMKKPAWQPKMTKKEPLTLQPKAYTALGHLLVNFPANCEADIPSAQVFSRVRKPVFDRFAKMNGDPSLRGTMTRVEKLAILAPRQLLVMVPIGSRRDNPNSMTQVLARQDGWLDGGSVEKGYVTLHERMSGPELHKVFKMCQSLAEHP
jgi:hypothetical protein